MDKFEALEEFGLENREAKIYVKLLELGQATASEIVKTVNILRPTVYDILNNMIKKGVVTYSISAGKKVFSAVEPEVLQQIAESKKKLMSEFMPELKEISKVSKVKPVVETYVGARGLKTIYDDMLVEGKDIYHIMNYDEYSKLFQLFFIKNFIEKRVEKGVWFKAIVNYIKDPELEKSNSANLREIRTLEIIEKSKATIFFYGNKCGFLTFTETPIGIIIENEIITSSFKVLFDFMWEQAKET